MSYSALQAGEAFWRPSNQLGVLNTDLAKQLGARDIGARMWRLAPGQASTRHRHQRQIELYVVLEAIARQPHAVTSVERPLQLAQRHALVCLELEAGRNHGHGWGESVAASGEL
jgi:hypothetical protein